MHIHILGICGTFMGGVALLARAAGHTVTGSDENVYPPMSTMLAEQGIEVMQGFSADHLDPAPDMVVIGNVMSRGKPAVEHVLNKGLPYTSGPQWLSEHVLKDRWVLAVSGTHGKTTTSSMLAWILEDAGLEPGFLIGGIAADFGVSARFGDAPFFVVEADEYDTAFFDKRSKFVHYRPRTLIINNIEFDHADIFDDIAAIRRQFHHLVRTVPSEGRILANASETEVKSTLDMGCWSPVESIGDADGWQANLLKPDGSEFEVSLAGETQGTVRWGMLGEHNVNNALAAIGAARHVGVKPVDACDALSRFKGVKRRMEFRGEVNGVRVYDDFAHHPTAITTTLAGVRAQSSQGRILAVLEPRSNTMRMGVHSEQLAGSLKDADQSFIYQGPGVDWDVASAFASLGDAAEVFNDLDALVQAVKSVAAPEDRVVVMSNGGFGGVHDKLLEALA